MTEDGGALTAALERIGHPADATWPGAMLESGGQFRYVEWAPPRPLTGLIECLWRSRVGGGADQRLRLVPDGCVELSRSNDGQAVVFGPSSRWSDLVLPAGASFNGVRVRPGAAPYLLGVDADELAGSVVPLDELPRCRQLGRVGGAAWFGAVLATAEERVHSFARDPVAFEAPRLMASAPSTSISAVAAELALSSRQFRRRFERAVGISPSTCRRMTRVHAALAAAAAEPRRPLTVIAHDQGFADQAHLSREVSRFTGRSPSLLLDR